MTYFYSRPFHHKIRTYLRVTDAQAHLIIRGLNLLSNSIELTEPDPKVAGIIHLISEGIIKTDNPAVNDSINQHLIKLLVLLHPTTQELTRESRDFIALRNEIEGHTGLTANI